MKKNKPLRKQSKPRRAFAIGKYLVQKSLILPMGFCLVGVLLLCLLLTLAGFFFLMIIFSHLFDGFGNIPNKLLGILLLSVCLFLLCFIDYIGLKALQYLFETPRGTFLNPLPPEPNEVLPDNEVLVRASSLHITGDTLLRAAASQPDNAPEILLRSTNARIEN